MYPARSYRRFRCRNPRRSATAWVRRRRTGGWSAGQSPGTAGYQTRRFLHKNGLKNRRKKYKNRTKIGLKSERSSEHIYRVEGFWLHCQTRSYLYKKGLKTRIKTDKKGLKRTKKGQNTVLRVKNSWLLPETWIDLNKKGRKEKEWKNEKKIEQGVQT